MISGHDRFNPVRPATAAALICAAPLLTVAALGVLGPWTDYMDHIARTRLHAWLGHTALVTVTAALYAGLIGAALAWLVSRYLFPGRGIFEWLLALPLAAPAYVSAYAWYDLTQSAGPLGFLPTVRGPIGAGLIFGLALYPYVYLLARAAFAGQSNDAYEAARTLGARPLGAFLRAALPMARLPITAGLALVVMESLADYGAVIHLGAPTLSVGVIRAWAGEGAISDAARLALILVIIAFIPFALERNSRRRSRQSATSGRRRPPHRTPLSAPAALLVVIVCFIPVMLGLIIPLARLGHHALHAPIARNLMDAAGHSLTLAAISGLAASLLGLTCAYALRSGHKPAIAAARLAGLGYAVPGSVAALGVLVLLGISQSGLDQAWRAMAGNPFPILLNGSVIALIFAYQSRFAAAAIGPSESALARVTPALNMAARTLGAGPGETAWRVHRPLISSGSLLAALLVFVEVLKELPATMILRPFNYDTLAVIAHNYASDERLGEAALPALLITLIALPPMIWIARRLTRQEALR